MSSATTSPSPRQEPTRQQSVDESQLPAGHCRYILLLPELRGHRCGCTHFNLNRNMPGATCECGHLSCYHVNNAEPSPTSGNQEMELLKQRLLLLEREHVELHQLRHDMAKLQDQVHRDREREHEIVVRVSELEDAVEKSKADASHEVQEAYRNLGRAWDSISDLTHHKQQTDNHLRNVENHLRGVDAEVTRIGTRQLELVDVNISLEERVESLETFEERIDSLESLECLADPNRADNLPAHHHRRESMTLPSRAHRLAETPTPTPSSPPSQQRQLHLPPTSNPPVTSSNGRPIDSGTTSELWTVHVSLMPTRTVPFPFERDTNAYKRCLSRGLHQMIAVNGSSADAFVAAIEAAFGSILRGRSWMPLKAVPCTAEQLAGLPMLRQLDPAQVERPYDLDFLRNHCGVCDMNGKIDSLYIAMREKSLSWHRLRRSPVYLEGLELSWAFDPFLDTDEEEYCASSATLDTEQTGSVSSSEDEAMGGTGRPSAGDIVASLPSLKRAASEMSRSSSFGSSTAVPMAPTSNATAAVAAEGEGSRPKMPRIYPLPNIVEVRQGVKTS